MGYDWYVNLSILADDIVAGESSNVKVFLFDEFGNPLSLRVNVTANGKSYPVQINDGEGSVIIDPIQEIGGYEVSACLVNE